jgi:hypothetical protein
MRTDEILNAIKLNSFVPISQYTLKDEDLLGFCDREIELSVVPALLEYREEYLVHEKVVPMVPGRLAYPIPYRAVGGKLRAIYYSPDGGKTLREMTRINYDQRADVYSTNSSEVNARYFFVRGNDVVLLHEAPSGHLVFNYYMKPNKLVLPEKVGFPASINFGMDIDGNLDPSKTTIVFSQILPESLALGKVDLLEGKAGYRTFNYDVVPTATSEIALEFNAPDVSTDFSIDDYVAVAKESVFPQIPDDLHTLLIEHVSQRAMKALGDQQGYAMNEAKVQKYENNLITVANDRVESAPQKIVSRHGALRSMRRTRR